jgi:hypothetical protein
MTLPLATRPDNTIDRHDKARQLLVLAIGFQLALALPSLAALAIDDRILNGISVWIKPLKFQASLIILLGTLLWLLPLIDPVTRAGRGFRLAAWTAAAMSTAEIAYIALQAARGRASHFNNGTPMEALAYSVMGIGATLLVLSAFAIGLYLARRPTASAPDGLRTGGAWGLMLGSLLTLVTAFILAGGQVDGPGHWVGGIKRDTGGLFLFGWSRTGGDLRVPHFFATHMMQALPLLGLCLDRFAPKAVRPGLILGALAGTAVVAATFLQAIGGRPFL